MAVGLPWLFFCLFALHGPLGYSKTSLEEKIKNLEKKLELMYDTVTELTSENVDLKTRLKALEDLVIDGKHLQNCQPEALRRSGNSNADRMTFPHRTNDSENRSGKNIVIRRNSDSHIKDYIFFGQKMNR